MNKYQALAALIIDEVRAAEVAGIDEQDPQEAEALVLDRVESFLREHIHLAPPSESQAESPEDDSLSVPDPSSNLNLGEDRWKWRPGA